MRTPTIGSVSPSFLKRHNNRSQTNTKHTATPSAISDEFRVKLALEMRDKIFAVCQKDLLCYDDLMKVLGLSRGQVFRLLCNSSLPVKKVNGCKTVSAIGLAHWMLEDHLT